MFSNAAARNYAKAFIEVARGRDDLPRLAADFHDFVGLATANPSLAAALKHPALPVTRKHTLIDEVVRAAAGLPILASILKLLVSQGQVDGLAAIDAALARAVDREIGIVRAEVRVAQPIGEAELGRITAALAKAVGKKIEATVTVDPSLVGGFVARAGDLVFDGSISRQMERLRSELVGGQ